MYVYIVLVFLGMVKGMKGIEFLLIFVLWFFFYLVKIRLLIIYREIFVIIDWLLVDLVDCFINNRRFFI